MSNGRKYYGIDGFKEINKKLGIKSIQKTKTYDEQTRSAQRIKFCRCKVCGGMMTFAKGTNSLICENMVEKKKIKELEDGSKLTNKIIERCGAINLVSDEYIGYLAYLFDGVPGNQAVIDAKAKVKTKSNKEDK